MQDHYPHALEHQNEREKSLGVDRRKILSLPPERALDAVLDYPYPVTLVQSMAEEDLYMLVHAVGPDDALQLLGMASNEQWQYFMDMESWARDRIEPYAMTQWFDRLLKADPDRFTHWIGNEQLDSFEYYLFRNIELHVREYEEDPAEVGDGFFSEDNVHYIRLRPYPDLGEEIKQQQEVRDSFLADLLKRLSVFDFVSYQKILLESAAVIPAEAEEELLRLRDIRLAEKGFLPFEEAVGVYQPLSVKDLLQLKRKPSRVGGRVQESYPLNVEAVDLPDKANYFTRTLARLQDEVTLQRLQFEFAGLCNQVIAADQKIVRDKTALAEVVAKVGDYISLGLEKTDVEAQTHDPYRSANLIQNHLLADIFRVGYGCALNLKWRADRWRPASWFTRAGLKPAFWGEAWLGVLGGLLIKKPLYYDNYATGVLYREFATLADIDHTQSVLGQIIAVDDLFAMLAVDVRHLETVTFLTYQNLILTLWANHELGMKATPQRPQQLTLDQFKAFFKTLWKPGPKPVKIKDVAREGFLTWLAVRSGLAVHEITERMGLTLEALFNQLENEFGSVKAENLDPRYIQLFLLAHRSQ